MRMPFGKYKGLDLKQLDEGYLLWVYQNCDKMPLRLRRGISEELSERGYVDDPEEPPMLEFAIDRHQARLFEHLIEFGYKKLVKLLRTEDEIEELNSMMRSLWEGLAAAIAPRPDPAERTEPPDIDPDPDLMRERKHYGNDE
jgi:hypothetical protein